MTQDPVERRSTADLSRDALLDRIDALTAERDAVLEEAAKACEELRKRTDIHVTPLACAAAIRTLKGATDE